MNSKNYYIKIFDSPRSKLFPEKYNFKIIEFRCNQPIIKSIFTTPFRILKSKELLRLKKCNINIEYNGNIFFNFWLLLFLISSKNKISLDCHNSAIEKQKKHYLRYYLNKIYLLLIVNILNVDIIVHNEAIKPKYLNAKVIETPYPIFNNFKNVKKENDVIFLCSLNSDEPIAKILEIAETLNDSGYNVLITGNYNKVKDKFDNKFFAKKYLSYDEYINSILISKVSVCLTTRDKTLLFAPRESIALGVKCIVNNSKVNRDFYKNKANYIDISMETNLIVEEITKELC